MKKITRTLLCCAGLAVLSWSHPALAAIPGPERLLPDDTLVVVTIPDFGKMREISRTSPQTQLWNDPALKPFRDKFMAKVKSDVTEPLERELGVKLQEYIDLPQGQLTLAVTRADWQSLDEGEPGLLLMLDARDKAGVLRTNLAELRKKWIDSGKAIKTEKVRDVEFSILSFSEKDLSPTLRKLLASDDADVEEGEDAATDASTIVFGQHESLLIIGTSVKAVEKVAVRLSGGSVPALGELATFESSRAGMFRDAPLYGWVNAKAFMDLLIPKSTEPADDDNPFAIFNPEKIFSAIGIRGIQTVAFNMLTAADGTSVQFSIGIPESSRQGLFRLFPGEAKDAGPPPFVAADVAKFQRWRIDGQKAWATLEKMLTDISPQVGGMIGSMMDMINMSVREQDPNFDVRKNLIGNLGDDVIGFQKPPTGSTLVEISSPPSIYLIGSPRPEQLASALRTVLSFIARQAGGVAPTEREFLGRKVYSLSLPSSPLEETSQTLHCAATASYVALSTDVSMLEGFIRNTEGQQKPLRELAGLTEATAKVGGSSSGWFGYENQAETTRAVIEMLRKNASDDSEPMLAPGIPAFRPESVFKEWFDFSLLPSFDRIAKYFHYSVYSAGSTVDGIWIKVFAPVPPQLRK